MRMAFCVLVIFNCAFALEVSVTDYGAAGLGNDAEDTPCTEAFQNAIDAVRAAGGGKVSVPPGVYLVGPLNLTSHLVLWLASGATLKSDTNQSRLRFLPPLPSYGPADYPEGYDKILHLKADLRDSIPRYQPLLFGTGLENVTVTGENGTLDGQGVVWWQRWLTEPLWGRPHLVEFDQSRGITLRNVTLTNPGYWSVHLWQCEHVVVQFLNVLVVPWEAPVRPTNTDGVDVDSTKHVLIEDSYFQTGDDAVVVKSGWDCYGRQVNVSSENITVRRIVARLTQRCGSGGFAVGSEMSGGVQGVEFYDSVIMHAGAGIIVKVGTSRGGYVKDFYVHNVTIEQTLGGAMEVTGLYNDPSPFCKGQPPPETRVSDITFEDVRVLGPTGGKMVELRGTQQVQLQNITLRRVHAIGTGKSSWDCSFVTGQVMDVDIPDGVCPGLIRVPDGGEPLLPWRDDVIAV